MQSAATQYLAALLACVLAGACISETGSDGAAFGDRRESCTFLNFDRDGDGDPIAAGAVVEDAYLSLGVEIDVWRDDSLTREGLGVAFDTDNPTGNDWDLAFSGLGNVLINQESFTAAEVAAGQVAEPDDEAGGALFEFRFAEPVCINSLVLLDIDFGEAPAELVFYDGSGAQIADHQVAPMGDNVRIDVPLPSSACQVRRMTVLISSSGAMDDLEVCGDDSQEPEIWTRIFDGGGDDGGRDVTTNANRDVLVCGVSEVGATTDGVVRKYDRSGLLGWSTAVSFVGDDSCQGIDADASGDLYITGRAGSAGDDDIYLRKLADDGSEIWTRIFDGGGDDAGMGVAVDDAGDIVLAGYAEVGAGDTDIVVRKYDGSGGLIWSDSFDQGAGDIGYAVATGPGGRIAVAGQVDNGSDADFWVRLYDSSGTELWTRLFDGGGDDVARGVAIADDGSVVVGGEAWGGANSDALVRKYADDGSLLWSQAFDGGGTDAIRGVATDAGGNVIVTGFTDDTTRDGWTRKLDPAGVEQWTELFDAGGADDGYGVTADIAGSVIATGELEGDTDVDLWVAKYRP